MKLHISIIFVFLTCELYALTCPDIEAIKSVIITCAEQSKETDFLGANWDAHLIDNFNTTHSWLLTVPCLGISGNEDDAILKANKILQDVDKLAPSSIVQNNKSTCLYYAGENIVILSTRPIL